MEEFRRCVVVQQLQVDLLALQRVVGFALALDGALEQQVSLS